MRQRRELYRHTEGGKFVFDIVAPAPGANQPLTKPVLEALLVANAFDRRSERCVADPGRPQSEHTCLFFAEIVPLAAGQAPQYRLKIFPVFCNTALTLTSAHVRRQVDALIDHREIAVVMQYTLRGRIARKNIYPEVDIALQFRGNRKGIGRLNGWYEQQYQEGQYWIFSCH